MSKQLDAIRELVNQKLAEKRHNPAGSVYLANGLYIKADGKFLVLFDAGDSRDTQAVGLVSPEGEWQVWPVWYEVIGNLLGVSIGAGVEGEAA